MSKHVFLFGGGTADGDGQMRNLLGGKGANLAEMCRFLGLPVPPGFTVTTAVCGMYHRDHRRQLPKDVIEQIGRGMSHIQQLTGKTFGGGNKPLLVSVRSGAASSMPGMMETILNVGLNDITVVELAKLANARFAYDSYRRLVQMYGSTVAGVENALFADAMRAQKQRCGVQEDTELTAEHLEELTRIYLGIYRDAVGDDFPQDPGTQLLGAAKAVFESWHGHKAVTYRQIEGLNHLTGTAVNVQGMVFGNMGENSGTGVAFTRDPNTGENVFWGNYLMDAQGEDVVAGIRTPLPLSALAENNPRLYEELLTIRHKLEQHYHDMQDIEFTIEDGKLYILQTRSGKRTAGAAIRIAMEMLREGHIDTHTALSRVDASSLRFALQRQFDPDKCPPAAATGIGASPGAASGVVVLSPVAALAHVDEHPNVPCILVREETSPEDVRGMHVASGILTRTGGSSSHAAVVAKGWNRACVAGCEALHIDEHNQQIIIGGQLVKAGEYISIDGTTGQVMLGQVPTIDPVPTPEFYAFLQLASEHGKIAVRTNADSPTDAATALLFGATGIGLCRVEHMFFAPDKLLKMRELILASTTAERQAALNAIMPLLRIDFEGIFEAMNGKPVTIRLIDPPLHEFLPTTTGQIEELAATLNLSPHVIEERVRQLEENNPMLGHRGCRLGITYPEITAMQAEAIFTAALNLRHRGFDVRPEIMVPLVTGVEEFNHQAAIVRQVAQQVMGNNPISYKLGTMIETPAACVNAAAIAKVADFFSFGTNDLTQMTLGVSRDDAGKFLPAYAELGIVEVDPFVSVHPTVLALAKMAIISARAVNPNIKLGVCGEHGGDPESIRQFAKIGVNYVSCSPYRVPAAIVIVAQGA